jgi:PAS domain S-box-containing protein
VGKRKELTGRIAAEFSVFEPFYRAIAVSIALVLAVASVYSTWNYASRTAWNEAHIRFDFRANQIGDAISSKMLEYEQVLRGGVGLFAASQNVERGEWRAYVQQLRIEDRYSGIQGIGFAQRVVGAQKGQQERAMRAERHGDFAIRPEGERGEYFPITSVEPIGRSIEGSDLGAVGFDLLSDPILRAAMERARDTGLPAISDKVALKPDRDRAAQDGFIMFLPVYPEKADLGTVASRGSALSGYVYGVFRVKDLMRGILGEVSDVRVQLFDGAPGHTAALVYDSVPASASTAQTASFKARAGLPVPGREWTLDVSSLPAMEATVDRRTPRLLAIEGGVASALALGIIWSLATMRSRAARLARLMTRELRDSRERLGLAIEGSNLALFDWDLRTGKVLLSEQWSCISGAAPRRAAPTVRELLALVHPEDRSRVAQEARALIRGRIPFYHCEHRVRTETSGWRWISSRAKVVERDGSGRAKRVAGTNLDITDRKEVERIKNEFVATVSHELRTPLTAVVGALGMLKREVTGKLPPNAALFLGMAQQNSDRLATLINDVLDIEKIESGMAKLRIVPVAVGALLERAVALNAPYAGQFDVRFELHRPLPDVSVSGDEDRLLQVMTNLMSNAAKFSGAGSAVTVSCEVTGRAARIAVVDQGPGVPEELRSRLFQKFAQAESGDARQKGGTGLGLSICKAIIDTLGGRIGYESAPGRGSTFFFELALRP